MALGRACNPREVLFAGAAMGVAWAFGGCSDDDEDGLIWHNIRYADRAVVDNEILKRKDVLIHMIRGKLSKEESRGGSSTPHSNAEKDGRCSRSQHPDVKGVRKRRNWDLIYDAQRAEEETKQSGIPNPIDAILYHEIFGHILPILRDPKILDEVDEDEQRKDDFEKEARAIENKYRRYRNYPIVPEVQPQLPSHE